LFSTAGGSIHLEKNKPFLIIYYKKHNLSIKLNKFKKFLKKIIINPLFSSFSAILYGSCNQKNILTLLDVHLEMECTRLARVENRK